MQKVMTFQHGENRLMTFRLKSHDFENGNHEKVMTLKISTQDETPLNDLTWYL